MKTEHDVDVIIPVLNGSKTIQAAIDSALNQDSANTFVVVVDAGSTDGTIELVKTIDDPRVQLISGMGTLTAGAARNRGVEASNSSWISFLDADDLWPYGRTDCMLKRVSDPGREIAVGRMIIFPDGADVDPTRVWPLANSYPAPLAGGVLLSRSLFNTVGEFDLKLRVGEFIDWMARARNLGIREVATNTVVLLRRNHEYNTSKTRKEDYASSVLSIIINHKAHQQKSLPY
jgi:glycosyltransferase involved in cell wall biosynthesis